MPWSDLPDPVPPPMTKGQRVAAIIHRLMIVAIAALIIGICVTSWFPVSTVVG